MGEIVAIKEEQTDVIINNAVQNKVSAILSYQSKGKWHATKILFYALEDNKLKVECLGVSNQPRPVNIRQDQPVGISFKHEYGKYVFDSTVLSLEPSQSIQPEGETGGLIVLEAPKQMQIIQRRSYFRVEVPKALKVKVLIWPRNPKYKTGNDSLEKNNQILKCSQGRLVDISAGGVQITVPNQQPDASELCIDSQIVLNSDSDAEQLRPKFKKGQYVGLRFTPMPYETPLTLSAQIRNILPTSDGQGVSIGMQLVGLEATTEGHQLLTRLITVVGNYYQMNQVKQSGQKEKQQKKSIA